MAEKHLLECTDVSKSFGPTKAIVHVNVTIPYGEVRGLIGENGSGKSTLCNMITGILKPDTGHMVLEGEPFAPGSLLDSKGKGISILLQETGTISGMTVAENIYLGKEHLFTRFGTVDKKKLNEQAQRVIDEMGLEVAATDLIDQLSFENRKLVEVIRAMTDNPKLLIVDETTTALSQYGRDKIYDIIKQLKAENKSVIFITHDLGVVANMADDIAVMYAGKIVEYGTAEDIFYDPRHPYTWALLSSMPDLDTKEKLDAIPGTPPNMIYPPKGDAFADRNKYAMEIDFEEQPPMFAVSETHSAATWLLHPDAPKVDIPKNITDRIARMKKKNGGADNG